MGLERAAFLTFTEPSAPCPHCVPQVALCMACVMCPAACPSQDNLRRRRYACARQYVAGWSHRRSLHNRNRAKTKSPTFLGLMQTLENEAASQRQQMPPAGLRSAARTAMEEEWARRKAAEEAAPPIPQAPHVHYAQPQEKPQVSTGALLARVALPH